jgi:hypothetical protein
MTCGSLQTSGFDAFSEQSPVPYGNEQLPQRSLWPTYRPDGNKIRCHSDQRRRPVPISSKRAAVLIGSYSVRFDPTEDVCRSRPSAAGMLSGAIDHTARAPQQDTRLWPLETTNWLLLRRPSNLTPRQQDTNQHMMLGSISLRIATRRRGHMSHNMSQTCHRAFPAEAPDLVRALGSMTPNQIRAGVFVTKNPPCGRVGWP